MPAAAGDSEPAATAVRIAVHQHAAAAGPAAALGAPATAQRDELLKQAHTESSALLEQDDQIRALCVSVGGSAQGASATSGPAVKSYRVIENGVIRAGIEASSQKLGTVKLGEVLNAVETAVNAKGQQRIRFEYAFQGKKMGRKAGWVSVTASDGAALLAPIDPAKFTSAPALYSVQQTQPSMADVESLYSDASSDTASNSSSDTVVLQTDNPGRENLRRPTQRPQGIFGPAASRTWVSSQHATGRIATMPGGEVPGDPLLGASWFLICGHYNI